MTRGTSRLVGFSDGVFAITIALLVLEITPPDDENLLHGLLALWPSYLVGVAVTAAFNAFYWLPIPGESPRPDPETT